MIGRCQEPSQEGTVVLSSGRIGMFYPDGPDTSHVFVSGDGIDMK